jgi:hypothetical protein
MGGEGEVEGERKKKKEASLPSLLYFRKARKKKAIPRL